MSTDLALRSTVNCRPIVGSFSWQVHSKNCSFNRYQRHTGNWLCFRRFLSSCCKCLTFWYLFHLNLNHLICKKAVKCMVDISVYHFRSGILERETVPLLTSEMWKKTVVVLTHKLLLPQRANLEYILSIYPLRYNRIFAEAKISVWPLQLNKICSSTLI